MKVSWLGAVLGVISLLCWGTVLADDLTGASELLWTSVHATVCSPDGECSSGPPWNWDVPQFIEIDLVGKTLSTTKASGENLSTPIGHVSRENGVIFLQAVERGRAFSFAIMEETGMVSAAVARAGLTVSVFGACTPMAP
ncbi:MAG: hypothetical protein JSV80_00520 [Acidobacteriota bacterium]|nr:MAG: hypothetical protein JSV80_00520 [Acidobacteriota bacterium]